MKRVGWWLSGAALFSTAPAWAGEEPLYAPAPEWVNVSSMPEELTGPPLILLDSQQRIESGVLTAYTDRAVRIDNPETLQAVGTIQAGWLPDKGDLIVHEVAIIRGGETIDVLEQGSRFDVLRREQQLEQRQLTGALTATMPIPGLRVGDVLRMRFSVTKSDQALKEEVQAFAPLMTEPFQAGAARVQISWPEGADIAWRMVASDLEVEPQLKDGYLTIDVPLPLPEPEEMPDDAPSRYRMPPMLQAGTFADWQEVSQVMAPLYRTRGTMPADGPLADQLASIRSAHDGDLAQAVAALRLVQDEVAYLANGMEGGNYIPQSPADTWQKRFGDCKAKTLLLLAMLREMGIEAEATLVSTEIGDAAPDLLPMPGAFNHVIVRAVIDGREYWLDGTSSGASEARIGEAPPFAHALPVREEGAGLMRIERRALAGVDRLMKITFDHRAGLDVPMLYDGEWTLSGSLASPVRAVIDQVSGDQRDDIIQTIVTQMIGDNQMLEGSLSFDPATNRSVVKARGLMTSPWDWDRGEGERELSLPTAGFEFRPDRSRRAWRDIPVVVAGPFADRSEITILLPESDLEYEIEGKAALDEEIASIALSRQAKLEGNRLTVVDSASWPGGELPAEQAAQERTRASRLGSLALSLKAPAGIQRRFELASGGDRSRLEPIEEAYAALIERDPEDERLYRNRAAFRAGTFDRVGALEDLDVAVEMDGSAESLLQRANVLIAMGRLEDALRDLERVGDLDPGVNNAMMRVGVLSQLDRVDEAIALLEEQNGTADEQRSISIMLSDLDAQAGRKEEGLARLDGLIAQRPGDPDLLNAKCWYQAAWNVGQDTLAEICTRAVERADWSPPVLDSRAMGYFRLGRYEAALADIEAALAGAPEVTASLLMRGVIRRAMGDPEGRQDIASALARTPQLEQQYERFGIDLN